MKICEVVSSSSKILYHKAFVLEDSSFRVMWHTSPKSNRKSILATGLTPRNQEYTDVKRKPGIYLFATEEQARDWAYWDASSYLRTVDVWKVTIPKSYVLIPDPHPEMDIFNAFIGYTAIAPDQLEVIATQKPDPNMKNMPQRSLKIQNFQLDENIATTEIPLGKRGRVTTSITAIVSNPRQ